MVQYNQNSAIQSKSYMNYQRQQITGFLVSVENGKNYHVFDSESLVVCKVIQLKISAVHQDLTGTTFPKVSYLPKVVYELSALENCCFVPPPISRMPGGVCGSKWAHQYLKNQDATVFLLGTSGPKMTHVPTLFAGFLSSFDFLTQKIMFY